MLPLWDTFALFNQLLAELPTGSFRATKECPSLEAEIPSLLLIAKAGFVKFAPPEQWAEPEESHLRAYIPSDLDDDSCDWGENSSKLVRAFCVYVEGAMMGMVHAGTIPDTNIIVGRAHLAAFIAEEAEHLTERFWA
jgi:hypothetical protein